MFGFFRALDVLPERIDHQVADEVNALRGDALAQQVHASAFFGDEEEVGDGVGDDAVDLFRHGAVEAAQAGLDMHDVDAQFLGDQRRRGGGVHVADDEDGDGLLVDRARVRCAS